LIKRKIIVFGLVLIILMCFCACDVNVAVPPHGTTSSTPDVTPTTEPTATPEPLQEITKAVNEIELYVGDKYPLDGLFKASFGGMDISADCDAFKIENGAIEAILPGNGNIVAVGEQNPNAMAVITVKVFALPRKAVTFSAGRFLAIKAGESQRLTYSVHPRYEGRVKLSATGDITLSEQGTVKGVAKGFGVVTATVDGEYAGECVVVVNDKENLLPLDAIAEPEFSIEDGILKREYNDGEGAVIMLTGDIMCLSAQQNAAKKAGEYDFSPSFKYVKEYFDTADLVIGNLESTLSVTHPYANEKKNVDGMPNCNGQSTILDALRYAGYDVVVTANNHSLDANELGLYQTLERLEYYKLASVGTYTGREDRFIIADINGIRVAFLAYTEIMNKRESVSVEKYAQIIGEYSKGNVERDCAAAREAGAEYIIAYMHWGKENTHEVTSRQQRQAKEMANAGVDLIAGSHPHCLQNATTVIADDGREVFCIYSLGNFVSSMSKDINNDTIILRVELVRDGDKIKLRDSGYIACKVMGYDNKRFVILPCDMISSSYLKDASSRIDAIFQDNLKRINN